MTNIETCTNSVDYSALTECLDNEQIDRLLKQTDSLKLLKTLLDLKVHNVLYKNASKIEFDLKPFYEDVLDTDLVCEVLRKYLLVVGNVDEQLIKIIRFINEDVKKERIRETHILKILNEVLFYCKNHDKSLLLQENLSVNDVSIFILSILKDKTASLITFVNSHIIPSYVGLIHDNAVLQITENIFSICKSKYSFSSFCSLFNYLRVDTLLHQNSLLTKDYYWEVLANCITSERSSLQKEITYILSKSIYLLYESNISLDKINKYAITSENSKSESIKIWNIFFTLLDMTKEKQLHLVEPSLKLIKHIKKLKFLWQMCLYKILLNHTQNQVVYWTCKYILTNSLDLRNLDNFLEVFLLAINKNEYSDCSNNMFQQLQIFFKALNKDDSAIFLNKLLVIQWCPTALWCIFKSIFRNNENQDVMISTRIFNSICINIQKLPHTYIRCGSMELFLNFWLKNFKCENYCFEDYIKIINTILSLNLDEFNYVVKTTYSNYYINDVLAYFETNNFDDTEKFRVCLYITRTFELTNCIQYFKQEFDKLDLTSSFYVIKYLFKYFDSNFVKNKLLNFDYLNKDNTENYLSIVVNYDSDKQFIQELCNLCLNTVTNANRNEIIKIDVSFQLLAKYQPIIPNDTLTFWENKFVRVSEKIDSQICLSFLNFYLTNSVLCHTNSEKVIIILETVTDIYSDNVIESIFEKLHIIFPYIQEEKIVSVLDFYYCQLLKLCKSKCFKSALANFTNLLFSKKLLSSNHIQKVFEITNDLLKLSDTFDIINYYLAFNINKTLYNLKDSTIFVTFIPIIAQLILKGIIIKKDQRIEYYVCQEVYTTCSNKNNPFLLKLMTRKYSLMAMLKMAKESSEAADSFVKYFLNEYKEHFNKRYFPDSQIHLQKLRIFQAFLLLQPYIGSTKDELINLLMESFCIETHQYCVKQLMQWLLILLTENDETIISKIKNIIDASSKNQPSTIVAFIPVLLHIILLQSENVWDNNIEVLLPYCMGAHFKLRVYSQIAIIKLFDEAQKQNFVHFQNKYNFLYSSIKNVVEASGTAFTETLKNDMYFFENFHPKNYYSIKSINIDILKHNKVTSTEWENITYDLFSDNLNALGINTIPYSSCDLFLPEIDSLTEQNEESLHRFCDVSCNIQKKITPWKETMQEDLIEKRIGEFILIATFVEKSTNLGGLSRTCEVFGVKTLILNDAKLINDKEFKSLSMSSENWVNVMEVKVNDLEDFIVKIKDQQYKVIGAEQTSESVLLNKFKFPKKTALILGNEKEGIPPNIISMLDFCIEIPQFGMVRSLNVHVAGATFIWEYAKQHLT